MKQTKKKRKFSFKIRELFKIVKNCFKKKDKNSDNSIYPLR